MYKPFKRPYTPMFSVKFMVSFLLFIYIHIYIYENTAYSFCIMLLVSKINFNL